LCGCRACCKLPIYVILDRGGGIALWSANEAYLFIGIDRIGHRVNALRFPWFFTKNFLGAIEDPDDRIYPLHVTRVTSSGIEYHVLELVSREPGDLPGQFTPRNGRIYANYPALGGLCVWVGDHFEPASPAERQGFHGFEGLNRRDWDSGWSSRPFGTGPGSASSAFTIQVADFVVAVNAHAAITGSGSIFIGVRRAGQTAERILDLRSRWGIVGKTEYEQAFKSRE